jgi:Mrp family chromosome partitioning ATPase
LVEVPSLLGTPDGEAVVRSVDVVVVVAQCFWTRVDQAKRASNLLRQIQAPTLGVVLTELEMSRKDLKRVHAGDVTAAGRNVQNPKKSSVRVG